MIQKSRNMQTFHIGFNQNDSNREGRTLVRSCVYPAETSPRTKLQLHGRCRGTFVQVHLETTLWTIRYMQRSPKTHVAQIPSKFWHSGRGPNSILLQDLQLSCSKFFRATFFISSSGHDASTLSTPDYASCFQPPLSFTLHRLHCDCGKASQANRNEKCLMRNFSKGIECPIARLKAALVFGLVDIGF